MDSRINIDNLLKIIDIDTDKLLNSIKWKHIDTVNEEVYMFKQHRIVWYKHLLQCFYTCTKCSKQFEYTTDKLQILKMAELYIKTGKWD